MTATTKCRAQGGEANCTDPACPEKRAHAARMAAFYAHPANRGRATAGGAGQMESKPVAVKVKAMTRALTAELGWSGAKPNWWAGYAAKATVSPSPHEPELLDVLDSPAGRIAVVWHEESPSEHEWKMTKGSSIGVHHLLLKSFETGEDFGYLKLSHVTDASFERSFGDDEFTPFRYKERFGGGSLGLKYEEKQTGVSNRNLTGQALLNRRRKMWFDATYAIRGRHITEDGEYIPGYMMTRDLMPQSDERIASDLREMAAEIEPEVKIFRKSWVHPLVDFSRIEGIDDRKPNPLANQGFGAAMYVYAARKLGQTGHMLRASDTQTNEAKALWARFAKLLPDNFTELEITTRQRKRITYLALDF